MSNFRIYEKIQKKCGIINTAERNAAKIIKMEICMKEDKTNVQNEQTKREENEELIKLFLLHMNAYAWSKGYRRLKSALQYVIELENPEEHQVKELYCEVATQTKCSWLAAERSLRYEIQKLWNMQPEECSKLFFRSTTRCSCPSVSSFMILFYTANKRDSIRNWVEIAESRSLSIYKYRNARQFIGMKRKPAGNVFDTNIDRRVELYIGKTKNASII